MRDRGRSARLPICRTSCATAILETVALPMWLSPSPNVEAWSCRSGRNQIRAVPWVNGSAGGTCASGSTSKWPGLSGCVPT